MAPVGPLASVRFIVECLAFTTSTGEDVWTPMGPDVSYADAQYSLRFLRGADDPLTVRATVHAGHNVRVGA